MLQLFYSFYINIKYHFLNYQFFPECLSNLFENIVSLIPYGSYNNKSITIDKKYKFLYFYIYNSENYEKKAYDTRIIPTNVDTTLTVKIQGMNFTSDILDLAYFKYNRQLNIISANIGFEVFGIF